MSHVLSISGSEARSREVGNRGSAINTIRIDPRVVSVASRGQ